MVQEMDNEMEYVDACEFEAGGNCKQTNQKPKRNTFFFCFFMLYCNHLQQHIKNKLNVEISWCKIR